jgi:ribosomal protein S18 acetylase RimI-like enzyme
LVLTDLPAGWTTRPPGPDDAAAVTELVVACDLQVIGHSDATLAQTTADLAAPGFDSERGGLLVHDADGALVGFLWTEDDPESASVFVDPYSLDPDLTDWLVRRGVEYVRTLARERGATLAAKSGSYDHDEELGGALERAGLAPQRLFWRMRIDLAGRDWPAPVPPTGVALRNPDPSVDETYFELHQLFEDSFAGHWGHEARSLEHWRELIDATAGVDPTQWWVVDVDGTPAGLLIADDSRAELGMTWVRSLGVLPAFRGRGLGRLLLRTSFAQAAARGRTAVGLGVDTENSTGATALYEAVGMRPESTLLAWRGDVAP